MTLTAPGARLTAAAGFARHGRRIADIGTDHAYLPVFLVGRGMSVSAVATDINRGPLERAASNIEAAGMTDRISLRLADGLRGVEPFAPEDIFILGMGGELIARICGDSDYIKNENIRLILQPMTRQAALRRYLLAGGFRIDDECLVKDEGERIYQIICAHYDGVRRSANEAVLAVGEHNMRRGGDVLRQYCLRLKDELERSAAGKRKGHEPDSALADERLAACFGKVARNGAYTGDGYYET